MKLVLGEIEILPIRLVAARFVAKVEKDGAAELEGQTTRLFDHIRPKYLVWLLAVGFGTGFTLFVIAFSVFAIFTQPSSNDWPFIAIAISVLVWIALLATWRWFQYGFGWVRTALPAIYANSDKLAATNIDLFFGILQRDTKLRAFYYTRNGAKRYVRRQFFFGRLRVLMLSEHRWIRELAFSPTGLWFSRELFIEADVGALIAQAKAKPNPGGRPQQYDQTEIVLALLEHPKTRQFDVDEAHAITRVEKLIISVCDACDEHDNDIPLPAKTEFDKIAKRVLAAIKKNRA